MTVNEASNVTVCVKCSEKLVFSYLSESSAWKLGICNNCYALPTFCANCQSWFMVPYVAHNVQYDWSCPSCGIDDLNSVGGCVQY